MLFTRESDYAIRIIRALRDGEKHAGKDIVKIEHIPEPFAYKVIRKLNHAGIVTSIRGSHGGYVLGRPLNEITLYDVIICIEPNFAVMKCIHEYCDRNTEDSHCHVHEELIALQDTIEVMLQAKSMTEILGPKK